MPAQAASKAFTSVRVNDTRFDVLDHWFWPQFRAGWESDTYRVMRRYLRPDRSCIDVGTWIGPTMLFAAEIGCRRIWGIEAHPVTYEVVAQNCRLNPSLDGLARLSNLCVCDCDRRGATVPFGEPADADAVSSASSMRGEHWQVEATTLGRFMETNRIDDVSFIKIDIEGAELLVLDDLLALRDRAGLAIHLSLHPPAWDDVDDAAQRVVGALDGFTLLDARLQPLSAARLEQMMLSTEAHPPWGTRFGNFFEVVIETTQPVNGPAAGN